MSGMNDAGSLTGPVSSTVLAAGAVLWRRGSTGIEIAIVHRPRYDDWSLPKGKLDPGESMPAAAVREVREETGCTARLGVRLGEISYAITGGHKTVGYWAAEAIDEGNFTAHDEVDQLRWVAPEQASSRLSYRLDAEVVQRFLAIGVPTGVVLLVRHAKAGSRAQWSGDDDLRPLSGTGHDQAEKLRDLLVLFQPDRIVAAPPLRCRDTVAPLARALNLSVDIEPLFSEPGYASDPAAAVTRLAALAGCGGVTVVCSQGGAIPSMVGALARAADRDLGVDPESVPSRKASTWLLAFRQDRLVAADYYERPTG